MERYSGQGNDATATGGPIFVNQYNETNPTKVEQPEYNTYLNGYLGLLENSNLAFYESALESGKLTSGGNTEGKVYAHPERQDTKVYSDQATYPIPKTSNSGDTWTGPGSITKLHRHSAYFGSIDKRVTYEVHTDDEENHVENNRLISGSVYTLDSPDSAFGTRPYVFRDGDHLRIDSVLNISGVFIDE